jgi:ethylmalonyl-CoA mutase
MVGVTEREQAKRDRPWVIRTYSGHSSARASNELYRSNLAKGQTGLSVAFDLPTQTGYDPDHPLARGEVGKVGVPVPHLGEMRTLFDQIPVEEMNTSMTINATAMWLLAMYIAMAEDRGIAGDRLAGTIQNDIVKEYLSRGTYIFGPDASRRLTVDVITHSVANMPRWNPINVCPYHLQEAGATPVQELAYGLATAVGVLDAVRDSGQVSAEELPEVVGRISFFIDVGIRFVEEVCKMRAFTELWDEICLERYGVTDEKLRRFRYGVQVNSLGLTEAQPENNVQRIVLEMLGVTLARDSRARAIQLPCWNEALGLPRPWDQQWSLRMQQVLAFETDLLEYGDIFAGSTVIEAKTQELVDAARAELQWVLDGGGAFAMIDEIKGRLVQSHAERVRRIESGDISVVGVNCFTETEPSPLTASLGGEASILVLDPAAEQEQIDALEKWRADRDGAAVERALLQLREVATTDENLMPATIELARAGGTVGEWAGALRDVFGEYRAPTGVGAVGAAPGPEMLEVRERVRAAAQELGGPVRLLVGKPGLDGHSNGAEQIAVAARDAGMEVVYQGIRLTPAQIAAAARDEDVDVVGLSILSGSHVALVPETIRLIRDAGLDTPVIVGGIIPDVDQPGLFEAGVARIYTPKDFRLSVIMGDVADLGIAHRRSSLQVDQAEPQDPVRNGSRRGRGAPMEKP